MRTIKASSFILAAVALLLLTTLADYRLQGAQDNTQLGIEITTNLNSEPLYLPANILSQKRRIFATVPVKSSSGITAVRIFPVMENGKVKLDMRLISGDYWKAESCADLELLPSKQLDARFAENGEIVAIKGEATDSDPLVNVTAVDLRHIKLPPAYAQVGGETGPCGCAFCGRQNPLACCPNKGQCIDCGKCGTVCCANG